MARSEDRATAGIHFNLDGMEENLEDIYELGIKEGILPGNITRWEFSTIIDEGYTDKTTFYKGDDHNVKLPSDLEEP